MMSVVRAIGFFVASIVIGSLVRRLLMSRPGEAAMTRLGHAEMATMEGASAAGNEVKRAVGLVKTLTAPRPDVADIPVVAPTVPGWVSIARDASEMLLAAGGLLRTVSDFVHEDDKLRKRVSRFAAKSVVR